MAATSLQATDKLALVLGATGGIGGEVARQLRDEGVRIHQAAEVDDAKQQQQRDDHDDRRLRKTAPALSVTGPAFHCEASRVVEVELKLTLEGIPG